MVFRRLMSIVVIAVGFFMAISPQKIYAQQPNDINNNPVIIMDKKTIKVDRRLVELAKESKSSSKIKFAKQKLRKDILRLKADKAALKKSQNGR
ncbi:MAG: hypothetical protein LHV69_11700 [Elusimicrobia bacterium]|nr:hypothetical protein [Candidatus Obscuribacterium magneticum]